MDSSATSNPTSANDAINDIRNDPDVYMHIRPTRNSNACASCRRKKKKCELGPLGPNTTCKRCSDYDIECIYYERTPGELSTSPSPGVTSTPSLPHPSWPPNNPNNLAITQNPLRHWPAPGNTTPNTPSNARGNPRQTNVPFDGTNILVGQRGPYPPGVTSRYQSTSTGFTQAREGSNPFGPFPPRDNTQGVPIPEFGVADPMTTTCECIGTSFCAFHMSQFSTPPRPTSRPSTSMRDWNPSYYPKNI